MATSQCRFPTKIVASFRLVVFLFYSYTALYSLNLVGNRLKFLTFWNLLIQCSYFGIGFTRILQSSPQKPPSSSSSSSSLWSYYVAGIVFPACLFVFGTFWILYAIDRELIFPKRLDAFIPPWLNHGEHSIIIPFLLIDMYMVRLTYPAFKKGIKVSMFFTLSYLACLISIYLSTGSMVYPILDQLDWIGKSLFLLTCFLLFIPSYAIGHVINRSFWGDVPVPKKN